MRTQLIAALNVALEIIHSQLDLTDCTSEGEPMLHEARCQQCHQLSPCSWRFTHLKVYKAATPSALSDVKRDFALAQFLINQSLDYNALSPEFTLKARQWLADAEPLIMAQQQTMEAADTHDEQALGEQLIMRVG